MLTQEEIRKLKELRLQRDAIIFESRQIIEEIRKLKELRLQRDAIIFESRQIINECADRTLSERIAKAYQWNIEHGVKIEEPQQVIRKVKTSLPSAE